MAQGEVSDEAGSSSSSSNIRTIGIAVAVVLLVGLGIAGGATAVHRAGESKTRPMLRLRLTGAPATQLEICGRVRRARLVAPGGAVMVRIKLAGTFNPRRARRGRLIVERCEGGRFRRVRSERFGTPRRFARTRRYRKRIDTTVAGDFRIRARLPGGRRRRPTASRRAYLRVSASQSEGRSPAGAFTYTGRCTELQLGVSADNGALAESVPAPFTPLGSPFGPTVTVGVAKCESTTADGKPIAPWTGGLAGTPIVPRGTAPAFERYWLWNVGNSPEVDAGFARLGLRTAAVPGMRLDVTSSTAGFGEALADVPWGEFAYKLEGRVVGETAVPFAGTSVFWHRGPRGLVKVTYELSNGSGTSGSGTVIAAPGSPLARLVGTNASGLALLITFDFKSTSELAG